MATSCYINGSNSPHRCRRTDHSIVFAVLLQCASHLRHGSLGQRQSNVQRDRRLLDRHTHTHTHTDHATWRRTVLLITHLIADLASNFARKKLYITFHTFPVTLCCLVLITGKPPTEYHSTDSSEIGSLYTDPPGRSTEPWADYDVYCGPV